MNRGDVKLILDRCVAHDVPDAADLIERQAAQIEMMRGALQSAINGVQFWMDTFPSSVTEADREELRCIINVLSTTTNQALEQFAVRVREQCAKMCEAEYVNVADGDDEVYNSAITHASRGIRAIKELP